ncbi:6-phosphogluconolactonase [Spiribacter vilamensis]|uniref:6-phosphogluconolactonase n=1 Tax=Spiribacter vilamensis TaxID=531306 RepID=A0A4Q8D025_9GAMM|nr:6-phosphogluconolactonase [Spiribacter vilamensis]RZU98656.1 6-phosphogluconolactonase [Spiribacter vilamensis]
MKRPEPAARALDNAQRFTRADRAASALATRISEIITYGARARGRASLLVPGGRTPIPLFDALCGLDVPWQQVYVGLTDERRVPPEDRQSNARLIREHLLRDRAAAAHFPLLYHDAVGDRAVEAACGAALGLLPRPFDAVVVGMGDDGHIASLFPGDAALARGLDPATEAPCVLTRAADPPYERLSLTLATLLSSRWVALLINGSAKWAALETAIERQDAQASPVYALLNQRQVAVNVFYAP